MKKKTNSTKLPEVKKQNEDIERKLQERKNDILSDISHAEKNDENYQTGPWNEKDFTDDVTGSDLDIPGAELDDDMENIGSEDEENNYYSLGGDNHNNLDEDDG